MGIEIRTYSNDYNISLRGTCKTKIIGKKLDIGCSCKWWIKIETSRRSIAFYIV